MNEPTAWAMETAGDALSDLDGADLIKITNGADAEHFLARILDATRADASEKERLRLMGRLEAAADVRTDLLAALEDLSEWISNWSPPFTDDEEWPATRDRVRAAIAKAKA